VDRIREANAICYQHNVRLRINDHYEEAIHVKNEVDVGNTDPLSASTGGCGGGGGCFGVHVGQEDVWYVSSIGWKNDDDDGGGVGAVAAVVGGGPTCCC
jgi:thiamine monophosphate synthase